MQDIQRSSHPSENTNQTSSEKGRRAFLQRAALAGAGAATAWFGAGCQDIHKQVRQLTGPAPALWTPLPHNADKVAGAVHTLNRVAYGPRPGDVARVANMGAQAYIEEQLADKMDEDPAIQWRVNSLDVQQATLDSPDILFSLDDGQLLNETTQAALLRAVYSRHQLRETLADFWTNHFNIYALKNDGRTLIPTDTERVIRPNALGSFREMLLGSAHSPAMLAYLDNNQNRRRNGTENANENYARELLELHTLGVKSGYTQKDIQEVARCFTGWTVTGGFDRGNFTFEAARHDETAKYIPFLDLHIAPNGKERDAQLVLEHLAIHPTTAHFVSRKLCRRFLGDAPDDVVEKAAQAYLRSHTDIRATLRPILLDALSDPTRNKPILKRPLDYIVSSLRAFGADTDGGPNVQHHLAAMGQPLYLWPMPDGFPEKASAWTGSLMPRWNYAFALVSNKIAGTTLDLKEPLEAASAKEGTGILNTLLETVYGRPHDAPELASLRTQITRHVQRAEASGVRPGDLHAEMAALLLCAPVFQLK